MADQIAKHHANRKFPFALDHHLSEVPRPLHVNSIEFGLKLHIKLL